MAKDRVPQPLRTVLQEEGLTYKAVADLCPDRARVSDQTVSDIATGKRTGSDTSRQRILNALNLYENKKREYQWCHLYREPRRDD